MTSARSFARYLFLLSVRRTVLVCDAVGIALVCSGHVTSPDTYFEGKAGPYPVRVTIKGLSVIPARTDIVVRTLGPHATKVTATARVWNGGDKGAPPQLRFSSAERSQTTIPRYATPRL